MDERERRRAAVREAEGRWARLADRTAPQALDVMAAWMREQVAYLGARGCVLGVSGGVDSTLVAVLLQRALPEHTLGFIMPDANSDPADEADALALMEALSLPYQVVRLQRPVDALLESLGTTRQAAPPRQVGNLATRTRYALMYYQAAVRGYLVVGSGDLDESYIGYGSKGLSSDIYPITGLHKDEVRALARLGLAPFDADLARRLSERPATPGFWHGQKAEDQIGFSYTTVGRAVDVIAGHCSVDRAGVFPGNVDAFDEALAESGLTSAEVLGLADFMMKNFTTAFGSPGLFRSGP